MCIRDRLVGLLVHRAAAVHLVIKALHGLLGPAAGDLGIAVLRRLLVGRLVDLGPLGAQGVGHLLGIGGDGGVGGAVSGRLGLLRRVGLRLGQLFPLRGIKACLLYTSRFFYVLDVFYPIPLHLQLFFHCRFIPKRDNNKIIVLFHGALLSPYS